MNVSRNFVITVTRNNHLSIFATWLHWNLASYQTSICTFSLIRRAHKTLKTVIGLLGLFQTSHLLRKCVSKSETVNELNIDCEQCGKRTHVFLEDLVDKFIDYIRLSRKFADKVYVIFHNSRRYNAQFLLRRFLELRRVPQLIMDATKFLAWVLRICPY